MYSYWRGSDLGPRAFVASLLRMPVAYLHSIFIFIRMWRQLHVKAETTTRRGMFWQFWTNFLKFFPLQSEFISKDVLVFSYDIDYGINYEIPEIIMKNNYES